MFLADLVLSQAPTMGPMLNAPPAGSSPLEMIAYIVGTIVSMASTALGAAWMTKRKTAKSTEPINAKIDQVSEALSKSIETQRDHVHATNDLSAAVSRLETEVREMRVHVAEIVGRLKAS